MTRTTFLAGKKRPKDELVFDLLGDLDEVNGWLGLARAVAPEKKGKLLLTIQKQIITLASVVAGHSGDSKALLAWLEKQIAILKGKTEMKKFVLPGTDELEARLHLARTAVRRAERKAVALARKEGLPQEVLDYLNRLSWFLFLLAVNVETS